MLKAQILSGEQLASPVVVPPENIQDLRGLFTTCRLLKKQNIPLKNRIHSLLKERLYGFTDEEIFGKKHRAYIRTLGPETMRYQVNLLLNKLEQDEAEVEELEKRILAEAAVFMPQIEILTSMKRYKHRGISVFIAIAIIADIIGISRFKNVYFLSAVRPQGVGLEYVREHPGDE